MYFWPTSIYNNTHLWVCRYVTWQPELLPLCVQCVSIYIMYRHHLIGNLLPMCCAWLSAFISIGAISCGKIISPHITFIHATLCAYLFSFVSTPTINNKALIARLLTLTNSSLIHALTASFWLLNFVRPYQLSTQRYFYHVWRLNS